MERNPHEKLIQLWAPDTTQDVEFFSSPRGKWEDVFGSPSWVPTCRYRLAGRPETESPPRVCVIPEAVVPAPLTEVPKSGEVWTVCIVGYEATAFGSARVCKDEAAFAVTHGLAFATKKDADAALDAMLARVYR